MELLLHPRYCCIFTENTLEKRKLMMKNRANLVMVLKVFLAFTLFVIFAFNNNSVYAKTVTKLSNTKMTIGIGTVGINSSGYYSEIKTKYTLSVGSPMKGATYTFTSDNSKIVTVKKNGTKANLTGIKAGTATITCKQVLKGKTSTIGKCKITVKKAVIEETYKATEGLPLGSSIIGGNDQEPLCYINNRNIDAKYTYIINSPNLAIEDTKLDSELVGKGYFCYAQTYTAKRAGAYTVTVNETYNKKTTKLGTFKVTFYAPQVLEAYQMNEGDSFYSGNIIMYMNNTINYFIEGDGFDEEVQSDSSIIYIDSDGNVCAIQAGTAKLNIYEGKNEVDRKLIGTCTITVNKEDGNNTDNENYNMAVDIINSITTNDMPLYDKILAVHDYIVNNTDYDHANYIAGTIPESSYNIDGVLQKGVAVCNGYAETFQLLMDILGVENTIITGTANGEGHAWNLIKVASIWYHIDVTFDDPVVNGQVVQNNLTHQYFMLNDSQIMENHKWDTSLYPAAEGKNLTEDTSIYTNGIKTYFVASANDVLEKVDMLIASGEVDFKIAYIHNSDAFVPTETSIFISTLKARGYSRVRDYLDTYNQQLYEFVWITI